MSISQRSGITAQWHDLITDAQSANGIQLDTPLESYLVHTLINYTQRPEIAARIFAIDYMLAQHEQGQVRQIQLRDLADQCLLYAGLFPQHAKHRHVRVSYYVDIGRSAYLDLADGEHGWADVFAQISEQFVTLMDTLLAIHSLDESQNSSESQTYPLDPLLALQTWQDTQSQQALKMLQQQTGSDNIVDLGYFKTKKVQTKKNTKH